MKLTYCKSENEFHCSPPWRACPDFTSGGVGVGLLKDIHFSDLQYVII